MINTRSAIMCNNHNCSTWNLFYIWFFLLKKRRLGIIYEGADDILGCLIKDGIRGKVGTENENHGMGNNMINVVGMKRNWDCEGGTAPTIWWRDQKIKIGCRCCYSTIGSQLFSCNLHVPHALVVRLSGGLFDESFQFQLNPLIRK